MLQSSALLFPPKHIPEQKCLYLSLYSCELIFKTEIMRKKICNRTLKNVGMDSFLHSQVDFFFEIFILYTLQDWLICPIDSSCGIVLNEWWKRSAVNQGGNDLVIRFPVVADEILVSSSVTSILQDVRNMKSFQPCYFHKICL